MSFATVKSAQVTFLTAHFVDVEVDISRGLHAFSIVGLPDKAVEEARDRIAATIKNSGFISPKQKNQKVVISLAPAELKKEGSGFDVAMAIAYLRACGDIAFDPKGKLFLGELSLQGEVRRIRGALPIAVAAKRLGYKEIFLPHENAKEAALISGITIFPLTHFKELMAHLAAKDGAVTIPPQPRTTLSFEREEAAIGFEDIRGQETAKRGLEIAAAGGHNIALFGPPGTGKTLLARALANILPPLTFDEVLEVTSIHSTVTNLDETLITHPPFRSPHHTASHVAVVGGGSTVKPGEVTLAHRGVLFLDELPEFDRRVIEALREPLEERVVSIARARGSAQFPANFILVAAFNPCPCGNFGSAKRCRCSGNEIERYGKKLSGPLLDRVDMWIEVSHIDFDTLHNKNKMSETSKQVRTRITEARARQAERFGALSHLNSHMNVKELDRHVSLSKPIEAVLNKAVTALSLSPRAYHRVLKLARTIADLDGEKQIEEPHVLEALRYRPKERA